MGLPPIAFSYLRIKFRKKKGGAKELLSLTQRLKRWIRITVSFSLLPLVAVSPLALAPSASANPVACSATGAAQNHLKVVASHGKAFYIDTGVNPKLDAGYVGYRVDNDSSAARSGLWVALTNFTGGKLTLANTDDQYMPLDRLSAAGASGETQTVYFMLKATGASTVAHTHDVTVYDRKPDLNGATALYTCRYTFSVIKETIKAAANKVADSDATANAAIHVSNTSPILGETIVISVEGDAGNVGAGNSFDGDVFWLTPAALSSWPTRALKLVDVKITFDDNGNWSQGTQTVFNDRLLITGANTTNKSIIDQSEYLAQYTFLVIGRPPASVKAVPVAQIASGTQMKHSDIGATGAQATISFPSFTTSFKVDKTVRSLSGLETTTITGSQYIGIPYRLSLTSTSSTLQTIDEVIDVPAASAIYKTGSASPLSDPTYLASEASLSPRPLHFVGPFTVKSGSPVTIDYTMWVPNVSDTYTNTAYIQVGDLKIGASATANPQVNVKTSGTTTITAETSTQVLDTVVVTVAASGIDTRIATLNATVDANGTSGTLKFRYGTNASLATYTEVTASTPASGTVSGTDPINGLVNLTGLSPGTTYYFRAFVNNTFGDILSFTTIAVTAAPTLQVAPASSVGTSSATFNGQINPNNTYIYGIRFAYSTNYSFATKSSALTDAAGTIEIGGSSLQDFAQSITGLSTNTTYYYKIEACTTSTLASCSWLSSSESATFTTGRLTQTINYDATSSKTYGDASFNESASATSGLTVSYRSLTTDVCTVTSSGTVTIVGVGECRIEASQGGSGTYNPAPTVTNSFTVNPKTLTITAADKSKVYGAADPSFTSNVTGLVGSDAASLTSIVYEYVGNSPTIYSRTTSVPSAVGSYAISPSSALMSFTPTTAGNNYVLSYGNGTYTISKATLTIAIANQSILETESPTAFTASIQGLVGSDSATISSYNKYFSGKSPTVLARQVETPTAKGSYFVTPETAIVSFTTGSSSNYETNYSYSAGTFVIRAAVLLTQTITLANSNLNYGQDLYLPSLLTRNDTGTGTISYALTGGGDGSRCSLSAGALKETLTALSGTGTCTITATKAGDDTYDSATATATITLALAPRNHTFGTTSYTVTYGAYQVVAATPQYGSGSITYSLSASPGCSLSVDSVTALISSGTCTVNSSVASDGNYVTANTVTPVTITLAPAALTVTADNKSKTEGGADPTFTAGITSTFQNSDSANVTSFTPSFSAGSNCSSPSATVPSAVGVHYICPTSGGTTLTFAVGSNDSYTVTYQSGTYTINAASRSSNALTMETATVIYQATLDLMDLVDTTTVSTGAISFTSDNVDCALSGSGNRTLTANSGTGTCTITATQAQDPSFYSASINSVITLAKKDQTISFTTPTDMTVGGSTQNLNVTATSGLTVAITVNSAGICSEASLVITAVAQGTCSLTANQAGDTNWNAATGVNRTFTINPAAQNNSGGGGGGGPSKLTPTITWANPNDIYSPTPLSSTQLNAVGSVAGVMVYSPASGTVLPVGRHTLRVTLNPTDSTIYNSVSTQVQIRVLRSRDRTILTWAGPEPIFYPTPLSGTQLNASANNPGRFTYLPAAGTVLQPGRHTLTVNFTPTLISRYEPASTQVSILVREVLSQTETGNVTVKNETPTVNVPGTPPAGPKAPVITINETTSSVTVTDQGKGVNSAVVTENKVEVKTETKFSGKTEVEVTYVTPLETRVVVVPIVVPPQAPGDPRFTPLSMSRSIVRWEASPNASRYEVLVRGQQVCSTTAVQCRVPQILGPAADVIVTAVGGDNLKTPVKASYRFEKIIIALTVNFDTAKFNLKPAARQELRDVAAIIAREGWKKLVVTGHTDSRAFDNQTLSQQRAQVTVEFLSRLLPDVEFSVGAFAANRRISEEDTAEGLAKNRRSELTIEE